MIVFTSLRGSAGMRMIVKYICTVIVLCLYMQEGGDPYLSDAESDENKDVVDINVVSAFLFLVMASVFLLVLYKFMSQWFLILLVVLFCIGGFEVLLLSLHKFIIILMINMEIYS
jgi:hypothetical protein